MFRAIHPVVWAFDCEWVPCARAGRLLLDLDPDTPEADVFDALWAAAGATPDRPHPFLPLVRSRLASVAVLERRVRPDGTVSLSLCASPRDAGASEAETLQPFLDGLARRRPQLVGFHSHAADLPLVRQRAFALGLSAPGLCHRPERPWSGPDYAHSYNEWNVDLLRDLGGRRGPASTSLADLAQLSGIPAKLGAGGSVSGADVARLWLDGRRDDIRQYNECDAVTTYLLWLRAARLAGLRSAEQHAEEEARVEALLEQHAARGDGHLEAFLDRWRMLPTHPLRCARPADTAVR